MKRISKLILLAVLSVMLICMSVSGAFAAETATVNGQEVAVGSTVTYTINIQDAHQNITGIHIVVFFDQELLTLESVSADNLSGSTINENKAGNGRVIVVNSLVEGTEGLPCEDKTELVTITFKVAAAGDSEISYYIPYLYDFDTVNIYEYKLTSDLSVDGKVVAADKTPILEDVSTLDGFDAGDFENSPEGTGSGIKPVVTTAAGGAAGNEGGNEDGGEAGNDGSSGGTADSSTGLSSGAVVGFVCAGIVVLAIVALVVVKVITGKKAKTDDTAPEQ